MATNKGISILRTRLSTSQCKQRLAGRMWNRSIWSLVTWDEPPAESPLLGNVVETGFRVRRGSPYSRRNPWRVWASGTFAASLAGTDVVLKLSLDPWVVTFEAVWLILLAAGWLLVLAAQVSGLLHGESLPPGNMIVLVVPPLMGLVGLAAMQIGRDSAAEQRRFLVGFLRKELDAEETSPP